MLVDANNYKCSKHDVSWTPEDCEECMKQFKAYNLDEFHYDIGTGLYTDENEIDEGGGVRYG